MKEDWRKVLKDVEGDMLEHSKLSSIKRYNTRVRIHDESVAEHSFYTAFYTKFLCDAAEVNQETRLLALDAALMHDVPEIYVNDITYDCKQAIEGLTDLLQKYEEKALHEVSDTASQVLFDPQNADQRMAQAIVECADVMSVVQYSLCELSLGNLNFNEIYQSSATRFGQCFKKLKEVDKENKGAAI